MRNPLPSPRHWFRSSAIVGFASVALGFVLSMLQLLPHDVAVQTTSGLVTVAVPIRWRWWALSIVSLLVSLAVWFTLARSNSEAEAAAGTQREIDGDRDKKLAASQRALQFLIENVPWHEFHERQAKKISEDLTAQFAAQTDKLASLYFQKEAARVAPVARTESRAGFARGGSTARGAGGVSIEAALRGTGETQPPVETRSASLGADAVLVKVDDEIQKQEQIVRNLGYALQRGDGTLVVPEDQLPS